MARMEAHPARRPLESAAMTELAVLAALSLAAWCHLVFFHGRFWLCDQRLDGRAPAPARWPSVVAVVPARDEADVLPTTLRSLLDQDYPGPFRVVLVDDESRDGTAPVAEQVAREHTAGARLLVAKTPPRPPGWVGKMWAVETGVRQADGAGLEPEHWFFTDADVAHGPDDLRRLVAKAEAEALDLVSQMVLLHAGGGLDGLLVPAFVYFFQKLYPFPRVNDPRARTAAAAGGCALVRRTALARAGGIEALRGEVIDDCALGRAVKRSGGRIWLGLSTGERSIRPYRGLRDVWDMVARSAFTQLRHSTPLLAGAVLGLALLYLLPPLVALGVPLHGDAVAASLGAAAWLLQAASFVPTLALYGRRPWLGLALPFAGLLYTGMTLDSARRHWRHTGALWKGRAGAGRSAPDPPQGIRSESS
jgi:hopene-associated glycosyltransferase HpnB